MDRAVQEARGGGARAWVCSARPGSGRARCWARCGSARGTPGCWCWRAARPSTSAPCRSGSSSTRSTTTSRRCTRAASSRSAPTSPPCCPRPPRAHGGAANGPAAGAAERFRYHRAVRALLELLGRERPVALLLDDLHWADDASVELVLHLLRRPPRAPHLLAFALRRRSRRRGCSTPPAPRPRGAPRAAPADRRRRARAGRRAAGPGAARPRRARGRRQPAVPRGAARASRATRPTRSRRR